MRIAFDIGGVLSKYPDLLRPLIKALCRNWLAEGDTTVEVFVISDMHERERMLDMLRANGLLHEPGVTVGIHPTFVYSADYKAHGSGCKAELCQRLGIDILVDDFPDYVSVPGSPPLRLLVMPDVSRPYYHAAWETDGSEGDFGRRAYYPKRPPHDK